MIITPKNADKLLPSKPTQQKIDPLKLVYFLIAPPKWGKTAFFMNFPEALLLAFEAGHSFQRGYKIVIDAWDQRGFDIYVDDEGCNHMTMHQAMEVLTQSERFKFVIIDTADMAGKMCSDFYCAKAGKEHISDLGDYGKGYDIGQNTPFRRILLTILKTGRGIALISHSKTTIERFSSGEMARKESTLPKGLMHFCHTQADMVLHGEMGKRQEGRRLRDRVLVCEGETDILAGNRSNAILPGRYIVKQGGQYAQLKKFFEDPKASQQAEIEYAKSFRKGK